MGSDYTSSWHSYPSIYGMGHKAVASLLTGPVNVEEKVDGSQFSFGLFPEFDFEGQPTGQMELKVRSKGAVMLADAPEKMFARGVETVKQRIDLLTPGWTYRGEYLQKPKHNALAYDRIPRDHVIIFDINNGEESYLSYDEKAREAARIGFDVVPLLYQGIITSIEKFRELLSTTSCLGGQQIEGVVVKPTNYDLYGLDKKVLFGKFVSEAFKEVHGRAWKEANPKSGDILVKLSDKYCHPGRWAKAVQHLREAGLLEDSPRDIPKIIIEIQKDLGKEEEEAIREALWKWAWPSISRAASRGMAEWYKERLLAQQFESQPDVNNTSSSEEAPQAEATDADIRPSVTDLSRPIPHTQGEEIA
jgi:hypothetical protein